MEGEVGCEAGVEDWTQDLEVFDWDGVGKVARWALVLGGGGGGGIVGQGPAADFGIEGGILDLERGFGTRDEMFEIFVEDVREKTILRSFLAFGVFLNEGMIDGFCLVCLHFLSGRFACHCS